MDKTKIYQRPLSIQESLQVTKLRSEECLARPRVSSFTSQDHLDGPFLLEAFPKSLSYSAPNRIDHPTHKDDTPDKKPVDVDGYAQEHNEPEETWFILLLAVPCNILIGMFWIAFPIFYIEFSEHFGTTKGTAGWIGSIQNGLQQFLGIITSSPIELYGCRINAMIGAAIVSTGIFLSAFATSTFYLYISYGVVTGVGLSFVNLCVQVIIQQHFNRNRSIATAISMIGKSIGQVIGPIVIQFLIDAFGWRGALMVFSAIFLNIFALASGFRHPKKTNKKAKGFKAVLKKICDFSMCADPTFVLFCTSFLLFKFNNMGFFRQLPSRMVHEGMDRHRAALLLSIAGFLSMIGRFISGAIGNMKCVNRTLLYTLSIFFTGTATVLLVFNTSFLYTAIICGLEGAWTGTSTLMANVVIVDLFGADKIARSKGLFNVFSAAAGFLATPTTGWIFDITGNYNIPFIVVGLMSIFGAVLALLAYFVDRRKTAKN